MRPSKFKKLYKKNKSKSPNYKAVLKKTLDKIKSIPIVNITQDNAHGYHANKINLFRTWSNRIPRNEYHLSPERFREILMSFLIDYNRSCYSVLGQSTNTVIEHIHAISNEFMNFCLADDTIRDRYLIQIDFDPDQGIVNLFVGEPVLWRADEFL